MSFLYPYELRRVSACFAPLDDTNSPLSAFDSTPPCLLWSRDSALGAQLLAAIAGEASNRRLTTAAIYDPLLPNRMTALSVERIGSYTLSPQALTRVGGLIDCTLSAEGQQENSELSQIHQTQTIQRTQIARIGRLLATQNKLRTETASSMVETDALTARAAKIVRRIPKGNGSITALPILSYGEENRLCLLPVAQDTRIIGLTAQYSLAALFLDALGDALRQRGCQYVALTDALTEEVVGILVPQNGTCYLSEAPVELQEKQLSLKRYLLPYTTAERRAWRRLTAASALLEEHLRRAILTYRNIARQEEERCASLYTASRLQNFRKRLLIDIFCKEG